MLKYSLLLFSLIPSRVFAAPVEVCKDASGGSATELGGIFGKTCTTYEGWIQEVWTWIMTAIIPLSVIMLGYAGFLWMTSQGDSEKITTSKKYIMGVISGVALLVIARILLVNVIGLPGSSWNVK